MIRRVQVSTGARLHFGPLAVRAPQGRTFGGVGLMVDSPGWEVIVERAERDEVRGEPAQRIAEIVARYRDASPVSVPPCRVTVERVSPQHAGLGSGTQFALAIGCGLSLLAGEGEPAVTESARRMRRGGRSAVGTHGFAEGGFLVDAGQSPESEPPMGELACRLPCPDGWRFVLATPRADTGLSGFAEQRAFDSLAPMPAAVTAELCRIVVMQWLPAVRTANFVEFSGALAAYGRIVGEYFRPVQGGVFANRRMAELAERLESAGVRGVAQTSWGPTIAICCESAVAAESLTDELTREFSADQCEFRIAGPLNRGARVVVE